MVYEWHSEERCVVAVDSHRKPLQRYRVFTHAPNNLLIIEHYVTKKLRKNHKKGEKAR